MHTKFLALLLIVGLAGTGMVNAQSASPAESPTASPSPGKHRTHKKSDASSSASPAAASTASPSPAAKRTGKTKMAAATSPSAVATTAASPSPTEKHGRKAKTTAVASPTAKPSPAKKTLADFFKPKSSVSPSPSVAPATTTSTKTQGFSASPAPGGGHGLVWVNTETHVYHKEGTRFYGTTKKGKYVSEADAIKEGDREAKKETEPKEH
jgi:hypothetical protein